MRRMVDGIHAVGLRAGWYGNNCRCRETSELGPWGPQSIGHYQGDVNATLALGFDGIKLDNCGMFKDRRCSPLPFL